MGTELSDQYIFVRSEVRGSRKLDPLVVNPLLCEYRKKLNEFKIAETKSDGGLFKTWVQEVDEFDSELLNKKTLLFSHKLKMNIYDSLPHGFDNYLHRIQARLASALGKIKVENGKTYSLKIVIETTGLKFSGGERTAGRWPREKLSMVSF